MNEPLHCECEHADHVPISDGGKGPEVFATLAAHEHRYGRSFDRLEPCRTSMGTFQLCAACRTAGHLSLAEPANACRDCAADARTVPTFGTRPCTHEVAQ